MPPPAAAGTNTTTAIGLVYAAGLDGSQLQLPTTPADATTTLITAQLTSLENRWNPA